MSAVIFSGSDVKTLKQNIDLFGVVKIVSGSIDPSSVATSAPKGSIYMSTSTGLVYRKLDAGSSTNWLPIGSGAGGIEGQFKYNDYLIPGCVGFDSPAVIVNAVMLSAVTIGILDSGTSGSSVIKLNQYRAGALIDSATASIAASAGAPNTSVAALSGTLDLQSLDLVSPDIVSIAGGSPKGIVVQW